MPFGRTLVRHGASHGRQCAEAEGTWAATRLVVEGKRSKLELAPGWIREGPARLGRRIVWYGGGVGLGLGGYRAGVE